MPRAYYEHRYPIPQSRWEILAAYRETANFTLAGELVGLTRERIRQVVMLYIDHPYVSEIREIQKTPPIRPGSCNECKRPFAMFKSGHYRNLCNTCYTYIRQGRKGMRRIYNAPETTLPTCTQCGKEFKTASQEGATWRNKRKGGFCGECYQKQPKVKAALKQYREERREEVNQRSREFYWRHKEVVNERRKLYNRQYAVNSKRKALAKKEAKRIEEAREIVKQLLNRETTT